jgi:hypothetical protein
MTIAVDAMVPWLASVAVIVFLIGCVWHNRRTGYQSERAEKIRFGEAVALIKQSLTWGDELLPVAGRGSVASIMSTQTEQLISLSSALRNRRLVVPSQGNEIEASVDAEALVGQPTVEK